MISRKALDRSADWLEKHSLFLLVFLTALYVLMLLPFAGRPLWHDELFTYYIGNAPSFERFLEDVRRLDLNPPMVYVLTRFSTRLFGGSPVAARVPSMIAFWGFSMIFFAYMRQKTGVLWASVTVLLFWSGVFFYYAAEARPYALILLFTSVVLLSYDRSVTSSDRAWPLAGVAAGSAGVILTHVFAPFYLAPFFFAEMVRYVRTKKADWPLWAAMVLPLACIAIYIPLIRRYEGGLFPPAFQPSFFALARFFWLIPRLSFWAFLAAGVGALLAMRYGPSEPEPSHWRLTDGALAGALLAMPAVISLALLKTHGAFWDRYCITSAVAGYAICVWLLARWVQRRTSAALFSLILIMPVLLVTKVVLPLRAATQVPPSAAVLESVHPELPLVSASGVTFLEMDHNESPHFKKRLYYLMDRDSAIRYAHATLFEGFDVLKQYFPIESNVDRLRPFEKEHQHFLVLSRPNFPENWLLPELRDEHATIQQIGKYSIPYEDRDLYEVTLPASGTEP